MKDIFLMIKKQLFLMSAFVLVLTMSLYPQSTQIKEINREHISYIEILPGTMPLVISIPHGGNLLPDEIPERPCLNCAKNQDIYTIEIGREVRNAIFAQTGLYPYVIINNLHRTRLDPNRNIAEAADGNKNAESAWREFQNAIDSATVQVARKFGKGLYVDLHGHRHPIQRIELGYLLSNEELVLEDDLLNSGTFTEYSSIRNLILHNLKSLSYTELVRGKRSLGGLLEEKGYSCLPAPKNPFPKSEEPYFPGGYNTTRHGSSSGGTIDGIQIELDMDLRSDPILRNRFSKDLATVLLKILRDYYFDNL
jgi:N-formylglutamate amidohydrolase